MATIYEFPSGEKIAEVISLPSDANGDYPDNRTQVVLDEVKDSGYSSAEANVNTALSLILAVKKYRS